MTFSEWSEKKKGSADAGSFLKTDTGGSRSRAEDWGGGGTFGGAGSPGRAGGGRRDS